MRGALLWPLRGCQVAKVFLFIDTSFYLHYKQISDIDWPALTAVDEVEICVPPVVSSELDKRKYAGNDRLKRRAERILREFSELLESPKPIRDRVTIGFLGVEPTEDIWTTHQLDKSSQDDRLIASALSFLAQNPGSDVRIVTPDFSLRVKAKQHRLAVVPIADDLKLPEEPDPKEKELQRVRAELDAQKNRLPQLKLAFADGENHCAFSLPPAIDRAEEKIARMAEVRREHPLMPVPSSVRNPFIEAVAAASISESFRAREARAHNDRVRDFHDKSAKHIDACLDIEERRTKTVAIRLAVENNGKGVADDLDIFLLISDDKAVSVFDDKSKPIPPEAPELNFLPALSRIAVRAPLQPRNERPALVVEKTDGGWIATFYVARLKQSLTAQLPVFYVELPDRADCAIQLEYTINCEQLKDDAKGVLHLQVSEQGHG